MYRLIGVDGKEYGPVTAEVVREWITAGRADGQTKVLIEGSSNWQTLAQLPEFAAALATKVTPPGPAPLPAPPPGSAPSLTLDELLARDIRVDIGSCFSRAWALLSQNFWPMIGVTAVMFILLSALSGTAIGFILFGPVLGGLDYYYLRKIRGARSDFNDAFKGFSINFIQLLVGGVVYSLLTAAGLILCIIPGIYLIVAWMFAYPLIIDKNMEFWPAMEASRKLVNKNWWTFFGLTFLWVVLQIAGTLACIVPVFLTLPWASLALMYAYEDVFGGLRPAGPPQTL